MIFLCFFLKSVKSGKRMIRSRLFWFYIGYNMFHRMIYERDTVLPSMGSLEGLR